MLLNAELPLPLRLLFVFLLMWQYNFHISDSGIAVLIVFLHNFLRLLSSLSRSQFVSHMATACPTSLYSARNILRLHDKYAVCPKCNSIYDTEQCIGKTASGSECSKHCWYVPFPNHPRRQLHKECGAQLLDSMHLRSGNVFFRPKKVFCYQSLKESITHLFQQEIFTESIQHWRERNVPGDMMGDVYDANIWHNFLDVDGNRFVDARYNLMLFLNVDCMVSTIHSPN